MYTLELAWFDIDVPDSARIDADVSSPSPLFSNMRAGTHWRIDLGRFVLIAALDPVRGLQDLSRDGYDRAEPAEHMTVNDVPGLRIGGYDSDRSQTDWAFTINGLMLVLTLRSQSGDRLQPSDTERREHAAIVSSVRRVSRDG
ncbi:MAG: hypothetical protein AAF311_09650 [Pseudomonadota bacterium]